MRSALSVRPKTALTGMGLTVLALWLIANPYFGITGDARFYAVQALHKLAPERFSQDLFFLHGSQDEFTIFSFLYAPVIHLLGLGTGSAVLLVVLQAVWIAAAYFFVASVEQGTQRRLLCLAFILVLPGRISFLQYGQNILTSRLLAEAMVLAGMGCLSRGRPWTALALLLGGAAAHPLIALPGLVLYAWQRLGSVRRFLLLGALGVGVAVALALLRVPPFERIFATIDPEWFSILQVTNLRALASRWEGAYWFFLLAYGLLYLIVRPWARTPLLRDTLVLGACGMAVSFVGGDLGRNLLITDLQLWRCLWLFMLVVNMTCGAMMFEQITSLRSGLRTVPVQMFLAGLACYAAARFTLPFIMPACVCFASSLLLRRVGVVHLKGNTARGNFLLICMGELLAATLYFVLRNKGAVLHVQWPGTEWLRVALLLAGMVLLASFAALPRQATRGMIVGALALLAAAMSIWDQRLPWRRFVETTAPPPAALVAALPGTAPIYWEGSVEAPWFVLRRSSYYACEHAAQDLFSRPIAVTERTRRENLFSIGTVDTSHLCPPDPAGRRRPLTRASIMAICRASPGLDALVLTAAASDDPGIVWTSPVAFKISVNRDGRPAHDQVTQFHIYRCDAGRP